MTRTLRITSNSLPKKQPWPGTGHGSARTALGGGVRLAAVRIRKRARFLSCGLRWRRASPQQRNQSDCGDYPAQLLPHETSPSRKCWLTSQGEKHLIPRTNPAPERQYRRSRSRTYHAFVSFSSQIADRIWCRPCQLWTGAAAQRKKEPQKAGSE